MLDYYFRKLNILFSITLKKIKLFLAKVKVFYQEISKKIKLKKLNLCLINIIRLLLSQT